MTVREIAESKIIELITHDQELKSQFIKSFNGRDIVKINDLEFACICYEDNKFKFQEFFRVRKPEPVSKEWTGEGLPPVGIDVEIHNKSGRGVVEGAESFIGTTCKVVATFINMNGYEMVSVEDSSGSCMCFRADMCGPVRTPEQIAAEERKAGIAEIFRDLVELPWHNERMAEGLYDAGYRKLATKEN